MNILILSGGSGNDSLIRGLKSFYPHSNIKVLINQYDNGKSTGVCREITNTLGVSDARKNMSRMYEAITQNPDKNLLEFMEGRFDIDGNTKSEKEEFIKNKLKLWDLDNLFGNYVHNFFTRNFDINKYNWNSFNIANIVMSEMYAEIGYENTHKYISETLLNIDDFVVLNSFDNVLLQARTESGYIIQDEGELVEWKNENDKIKEIIYKDFNKDTKKYGINQEAIELIEKADLILISTGTFWSSIYPTLHYLDLYKYINKSNAKKIWCINNNEDKDSYGVSSVDFANYFINLGLDLSNFYILQNEDAVDNLKTRIHFCKNNYIVPMENNKGKHNGQKYAKAVLSIYYNLLDKYDNYLFDFDDTIWSRNKEKENISIENVKLINKMQHTQIVTGNSFDSVRTKLSKVYGTDLQDFNISIWAEANSIKFIKGIKQDQIEEFLLNYDKEHNLLSTLIKYDIKPLFKDTYIKIKPLQSRERNILCDYLNDFILPNNLIAKETGLTTIDIVTKTNNKLKILQKENLDNVLYIGDEVDSGNDKEIANLCKNKIRVNSIEETNVILKLLEEKQ